MAQNLFNLPVGAKVKFGRHSVNGETPQEISWLIVAKNHQCTPAYPTNSVTLFAEKILDVRCYDAKETGGNDDRAKFGNNRYRLSNLDQWLNKDNAAGEWYVATHTYDAPPTETTDVIKSPYTNRPGFLHYFTESEKTAILDTTIRVKVPSVDYSGYEDIVRKVFLASRTEIRVGDANVHEGETWEAFLSKSPSAYVTNQCMGNSPSKPSSTYGTYWLRSPNDNTSYGATWYDSASPMSYGTVTASRDSGVRPALNLSASAVVSDTTDADGCYTLILNNAPSAPVTLNLPSTVYGGRPNNISWGAVTDPEGDAVTYELECAYNGGSFSRVYSGSSLSYSHSVIFGETSIQYRVRALDNKEAYSGYTTSPVVTIVNNAPPEISGTDSNLGVKSEPFSVGYSVTDVEGDTVTVTEAINGVQMLSRSVTLGQSYSCLVEGTEWLKLSNGTHSLSITATDNLGNSSTRVYTFTKSVSSFSIVSEPMFSTTMPTRISLSVIKNIPMAASFKVEVCNNGIDETPTWEDATDMVLGNMVHSFTNTSKTSDSWAVRVKITVDRNDGEGACYVSSIGGNFE